MGLSWVDRLDKNASRCDVLRSLVFKIVDCRFGLWSFGLEPSIAAGQAVPLIFLRREQGAPVRHLTLRAQ